MKKIKILYTLTYSYIAFLRGSDVYRDVRLSTIRLHNSYELVVLTTVH